MRALGRDEMFIDDNITLIYIDLSSARIDCKLATFYTRERAHR